MDDNLRLTDNICNRFNVKHILISLDPNYECEEEFVADLVGNMKVIYPNADIDILYIGTAPIKMSAEFFLKPDHPLIAKLDGIIMDSQAEFQAWKKEQGSK